jgi:putative membrane protein
MRPLPLAAGILLLVFLWAGPVAAWAGSSFAGHMVLHMSVMVGAAPLLVVGLPRVVGGLARLFPTAAIAPLAAALEFVVVWGWHTPTLCTATRASPVAFVAEQASWVIVGSLLWATVLADWRSAGLSLWAGVLALLLTGMHMTFLGTLITLASRPLYGVPLWDQQVGGIVMLAVGGVAYTVAGVALAARGLSDRNGPEALET